jgi:hypothetical protein
VHRFDGSGYASARFLTGRPRNDVGRTAHAAAPRMQARMRVPRDARSPPHEKEQTVHKLTVTLNFAAALALAGAAGLAQAQGLSVQDDVHAPQNSTKLMPNAPLGSEYPTHGNRQAGELELNPTDPRAQLANGQPNNAESGGYGSPLAGRRDYVTPPQGMQPMPAAAPSATD